MSETTPLVTAAEISRLAGVTRATVSNWRRRHANFPAASGGSESRPLFDLTEVQRWLDAHGVEAAETPSARLRTLLRTHVLPGQVPRLIVSLPELLETESAAVELADMPPAVGAAIRALAMDSGPRAVLDVLSERGLEEGPTTGVYSTPIPIARLMVELVLAAGVTPESILDPACGGGTLLAEAVGTGAHAYYGQDVLPVQAERTAVLVGLLAPAAEVAVHTGDSLFDDGFAGLQVDAVLTNPPYGQRDWGSEDLALDPRWEYGPPPRSESELAWVQHSLAHLRPGGVAVLLLPPAMAMRTSGRRIRAALLRAGALRSVIALPPGAAQPMHIGLQLWVLRRPDPALPVPDEVWLADCSLLAGVERGRIDWELLTNAVVDAWRGFEEGVPGSAVIDDAATPVRVMDLLDDEVDLTPARYVRAALDAAGLADTARLAQVQLAERVDELVSVTSQLGDWQRIDSTTWRTATLADLAAGGALRRLQAQPLPEERSTGEDAGRPVLEARDVVTGTEPTGVLGEQSRLSTQLIELNDVLVPRIAGSRSESVRARVAGKSDVGAVVGPQLMVLRTEPARLDPWFLAGFVGSPENSHATMGTTIRNDPTRIRIPLLPLAQQQRYGAAFRHLHDLRVTARRAADSVTELAGLLGTGLTAGALEPPNTPGSEEPKPQRGRK
ncbi:N-6 DNA methylase [Nocardia sp. NPDC060220]|uniref:N-6 DNA methylase n=1 Tax=Nocardia sp. NPDC060220 TaxID=3347076 RepID=UPI00365E07CA